MSEAGFAWMLGSALGGMAARAHWNDAAGFAVAGIGLCVFGAVRGFARWLEHGEGPEPIGGKPPCIPTNPPKDTGNNQ